MKRCKRCDKPFMEDEESYDHIRDLGEIYVEEIGNVDAQALCHKCREELGIMNLLGFGQ